MIELNGIDGSKISIEKTTMYSNKRWKEQKCWAFFCSNPFYFIHINRNGKATHAYCYHLSGRFDLTTEKGKWAHIEKGKIVVDWEFNRRKK